jgi:hypothetical protein
MLLCQMTAERELNDDLAGTNRDQPRPERAHESLLLKAGSTTRFKI